MSEEQSNFKVTDRRLFNPDGTPREYEREETADSQIPAIEKEESKAVGSSEASSSETTRADQSASNEVRSGASETLDDEQAIHLDEEEPIPGADDPASFVNFLMSIASNAATALGMMQHPVSGERGVDLQLGKHWIDILGMLYEKTRGNLQPQEEKIFTGLLADLRMQFVALSKSAPRKPGGGLTGRDIIGT